MVARPQLASVGRIITPVEHELPSDSATDADVDRRIFRGAAPLAPPQIGEQARALPKPEARPDLDEQRRAELELARRIFGIHPDPEPAETLAKSRIDFPGVEHGRAMGSGPSAVEQDHVQLRWAALLADPAEQHPNAVRHRAVDVAPEGADLDMTKLQISTRDDLRTVGLRQALSHAVSGEEQLNRGNGGRKSERHRHQASLF